MIDQQGPPRRRLVRTARTARSLIFLGTFCLMFSGVYKWLSIVACVLVTVGFANQAILLYRRVMLPPYGKGRRTWIGIYCAVSLLVIISVAYYYRK